MLALPPKLTSDFHTCAIFADKVRAYLEPGKRLYSEGRLLALLANIRREVTDSDNDSSLL